MIRHEASLRTRFPRCARCVGCVGFACSIRSVPGGLGVDSDRARTSGIRCFLTLRPLGF